MADQMDHDYSTWFLAGCRNVLASQSCLLAEGEQADVFEDAEKIMDCALDRVRRRFLLKVSLLRREFLAGGASSVKRAFSKLGWLGVQQ